jgi:hypothetical protein
MRALTLLPVVMLSLLTGCVSVYAVQPWPCSRIHEVPGLGDELLMMKGKGEYPKARTYIVDSDAKCAADRTR